MVIRNGKSSLKKKEEGDDTPPFNFSSLTVQRMNISDPLGKKEEINISSANIFLFDTSLQEVCP